MITPYLYAGLAALWIASIVATGFWQRHDGAASCESKWQEVQAKEATEAATRIQQLEEANRTKENDHRTELSRIVEDYEKRLGRAHRAPVPDIRSGIERVCDQSSAVSTGSGGTGQTSTPAPGSDATPQSDVLGKVAEDLSALALEADQVVLQLQACQAIVLQDRK